MPYYWLDDENMPEDVEPADVVEREEFQKVADERDTLREQRDEAVNRLDRVSAELEEERDRYAKRFLKPGMIVERAKRDTQKDSTAQSFAELWSKRTEDR